MAEPDTETATEVALWKERLTALEGMVTDGVLIAMHGGTSLQFRSQTDLFRAVAYAKRKLRTLAGETRRPGYVVQFSKGL